MLCLRNHIELLVDFLQSTARQQYALLAASVYNYEVLSLSIINNIEISVSDSTLSLLPRPRALLWFIQSLFILIVPQVQMHPIRHSTLLEPTATH